MQFKRVKNRVQVYRYAGYDKVKRRAIIEMVGSMSAYSPLATDEMLAKLDDAERAEVAKFIEENRQKNEASMSSLRTRTIASNLREVAKSVRSDGWAPPDAAWCGDVVAALDELQKALKKHGIRKPRKVKKAKPIPAGQTDIFSV